MKKLVNQAIIGTMLVLPIVPSVTNHIELPQINQKVLADTTNGVNNIDSLIETLHQPIYHLETDQGWSNDVQSLLFNNTNHNYDVYFLHSKDGATNPFGPSGQDWHHTTSDGLNGKYDSKQNVAIESHGPSNVDDTWKSAWTGSVTYNQGNILGVPKGAHIAYFSGLNAKDGSQNIYAAWSSDNGNTFSHPLNNGHPVLRWNQEGASGKKDQERDSFVTYNNGKMLMYCAEGNQIGVYTSDDGINWRKADPNGKSKVMPGTFFNGRAWNDSQNSPIECPQVVSLTDETNKSIKKMILFYGCKDPQQKETTGTYYVIGHLDSNGLFAADGPAQRLDYGPDFYGANVNPEADLSDPYQGLVTLGWIGNWNYTSQGVHNSQDGTGVYTGRLGSYSLPRTLKLSKDGKSLIQDPEPVDFLNDWKIFDTSDGCFADNPVINGNNPSEDNNKIIPFNNQANTAMLAERDNIPVASIIKISPDDSDKWSNDNNLLNIDLEQGKDYIHITYSQPDGKYTVSGRATELDNDLSGTKASSYYYDGTLGNGKGYSGSDGTFTDSTEINPITIYTDKDSIEIQFPNGKMFTMARFATNDTQNMKVYLSGDVNSKQSMFVDYEIKTFDGKPINVANPNTPDNAKPDNVINPNSDSNSVKVNSQNSSATTAGKDSSATTTGKDSSATTTGKDNSATTTGKDSSAITTGKDSSVITTGKDSSATATDKNSSAITTNKDHSATATRKDSSATTTNKNSSATTTGKNSSATTTSKNSSATTTGKNSSATATVKNSSATTTDKDSSTTTNSNNKKPINQLDDHSILNGDTINYLDKNGKVVKSINIPNQTTIQEAKKDSPFNKKQTNNATISKKDNVIQIQLAKTNNNNNYNTGIIATLIVAGTTAIIALTSLFHNEKKNK